MLLSFEQYDFLLFTSCRYRYISEIYMAKACGAQGASLPSYEVSTGKTLLGNWVEEVGNLISVLFRLIRATGGVRGHFCM